MIVYQNRMQYENKTKDYQVIMPGHRQWFTNAAYLGDKMGGYWAEDELRKKQIKQLSLF